MMKSVTASEITRMKRNPVDASAMSDVIEIVEDIRSHGEDAVRRHTERLDGLAFSDQLVFDREDLESAWFGLPEDVQLLLTRVAGRIESFARVQRGALTDVETVIPGGKAGHSWTPVSAVGAYAPGGRYPLPSTVLMTVIPAMVAEVNTIWVASPKPSGLMKGAAFLAGAEGLLALGGAQAIASLAFGVLSPECDLIVGPGNKWVTAAKKYLYGEVGIDGLAGPSEVLIVADKSANPTLVALDLLSQAEHDPDARPLLVTTSRDIESRIGLELERILASLPTGEIAREALNNGFSAMVSSIDEAITISDIIAPEHLGLHIEKPRDVAKLLSNFGSLFIGDKSAEAFADYGIGPNHVLPTGGSSRFQSGLSVSTFLRSPSWSELDNPDEVIGDTVSLARLEGLEAHARAAEARRRQPLRQVDGRPAP